MNTGSDRIRTTSGMFFKQEMNYLVSHAVHWKLAFDHALDRGRMEKALAAAVRACPYMGMSMEEADGAMWYVPNASPVQLSDALPERLGGRETDGHLFCLVFGARSLELVIFHGLTDGVGISWFFHALLAAYYGEEDASPVTPGDVRPPDYAKDVLDVHPDLPGDYAPRAVMPEHIFAFPNAAAYTAARAHTAVFSPDALKAYCREHNCSVTTVLVSWLVMAIARTYPANTDPICVRCPINSRKAMGLPHSFMNASLPQVFISVAADEAGSARADGILKVVAEAIREQNDRDRIVWFNSVLSALAGNREVPAKELAMMNMLRVPVIFSNLGSFAPEAAAGHILESTTYTDGRAPLMVNLSSAGKRAFLTISESFDDGSFIKALTQVMAEQGIALLLPEE